MKDCSFSMHEANIPNMDTRRELVHKPDKVWLSNRYLLRQGMELKQQTSIVTDQSLQTDCLPTVNPIDSPVPFASSVIESGLIKQKKTVLKDQNVVAD